MDIEIRLLRSFVAIYERGSLSRAASQLACTQAAMSMRLKLLETEIGEPLFRRAHHRLEPTFKGTEFYARTLGVLAAYDEMISATRSQTVRQVIRIGVPDDYALGILPRALATLGTGPPVGIEILCDLSANIATALQRHEVDLALVTLAARPSAALVAVDVGLRWVFHPAMANPPGHAVGIAAYPEGCVFRRAMIASLEAAGMPWVVLAQSRNHAGIVAAVRGGLAVTAMAVGTAPAGLAEASETAWLPQLPEVPLYLLRAPGGTSPEVERLAGAIEVELLALAERSTALA